MKDRRLRIAAERSFVARTVNLYVVEEGPDYFAIAKPIELERHDPSMVYAQEPTIMLSEEEAQVLIDNLWNAGLRPTDAKDKSEVVNAMKEHIGDLRKIALNNS